MPKSKPRLCLGIDPSIAALGKWGLSADYIGATQMVSVLLDLAQSFDLAVKPQVAYFEQFGPQGFMLLADLQARAQQAGLYVISDAKRTDIGSTSAAYARAWFGDEAPFNTTSMTATAYMGLGAIEPLIEAAERQRGQIFVVTRSSNPEGTALQTAGEPPVWLQLLADIQARNLKAGYGLVGAVVGATQVDDLQVALDQAPTAPLLCPGIGAQGATIEDLARLTAPDLSQLILPVSRAVMNVGPDPKHMATAVKALLQQIGQL